MIADYLKKGLARPLSELSVLELDPFSPLLNLLATAKRYVRTYCSPMDPPGYEKPDGSRCEDISRLTFPNESFDLIISSAVLEHVPDLHAAFKETERVLKPGGIHLFSVPVPTREVTHQRAVIRDGQTVLLCEPEYHKDPLNPDGILTFWDFGKDGGEVFSSATLAITVCFGPEGVNQQILWKAEKGGF
jgi:SAM-dependent methyltransferase